MSPDQQNKEELDAMARRGETVVPGGKSLEAQEHLAELKEVRQGRSSLEQKGPRRWVGKVGLAPQKSLEESGLIEKEGIPIDEAKFRTRALA